MFNGDPSFPPVPTLTTEQIQKYLEENKELILAIMECQRLGKFAEIAQYQAKLQHNLTFLAKLADAGPQAMQQGQGMQQPHIPVSQPQPDHSIMNLTLDINDQQQHLGTSLHQPDISTSKLPFQMNEQNHKVPSFFQQHQLIPGQMGSFPANNSGIYQIQGSQTRLGNSSDTPSNNQIGSDFGPWS
ncbi:GRF1-interacting factor 3-like [Abrus precatorius]|uniref:GRF1-interacting factor 3-like n=1 Tax=Abrus precatorius TaxID=3816 RepID=A0A8B8K0F1_ABRPR|nr:GRF1-interacting factor 3-like [Abrus precatorius]